MKREVLNIILFMMLFMASCSTKPEPIIYGKDQCEHCRMTIMDSKFSAEIITKKGKVYKFDAIECMINFVKSEKLADEDISKYVVTDALNPGQLVDAKSALYLISENFPSPMGANLSAYGNRWNAEIFQKKYIGEIKNWDEVLIMLKAK